MNEHKKTVAITGMGVLTPIGRGVEELTRALKKGQGNFIPVSFRRGEQSFTYPAAIAGDFNFQEEIGNMALDAGIIAKLKGFRNLSKSARHGLYCAAAAWLQAGLGIEYNTLKTAIVCSGTNTQQNTLQEVKDKYDSKLHFLSSTYGFNYLDTDLVGVLSESFGVKGEGYTTGAASASGNMAIIQAVRLINSGEYDVVLVVAPTMELSIFEYQGFTALGAMANMNNEVDIQRICNPFDESHCGFVYGESAGALILESGKHARERNVKVLAEVVAYGTAMDANRNPNPSVEGEARAMQNALDMAGISMQDIGYINTHGTGSVIGDETEINAILSIGGTNIMANATKGLIGHAISAAGVVEAIAGIIQMNDGFLHPNPHLKNPISNQLSWVPEKSIPANFEYQMSNGFGFGGINTSLIIKHAK
jgi:malonyl-ACP decarboxylase